MAVRPSGSPTIYFIEDPAARAIKIGYSANVGRRLQELQISSATPLRLLGVMPGTIYQEQRLHQMFDHMHGEWFRADARLLGFIGEHAEVTEQYRPMSEKKITSEIVPTGWRSEFVYVCYWLFYDYLFALLVLSAMWSIIKWIVPVWFPPLSEYEQIVFEAYVKIVLGSLGIMAVSRRFYTKPE